MFLHKRLYDDVTPYSLQLFYTKSHAKTPLIHSNLSIKWYLIGNLEAIILSALRDATNGNIELTRRLIRSLFFIFVESYY